MELLKVGPKQDITEGGHKSIRHGLKKIAVFKIGGKLHAIRDLCPHQGAQLSAGTLQGNQITCPRHAWRYDLVSGKCYDSDWACLTKYRVNEKDGVVFVECD